MLISNKYKQFYTEIHEKEQYGNTGVKWAVLVQFLVGKNGKTQTILDYGCGRGSIKAYFDKKRLLTRVKIFEYDPGIKGKTNEPEKADMIVCTDVLEHIEYEYLSNVLNHIYGLMNNLGLITISLVKSRLLPDGTNAHVILESRNWWKKKLQDHNFKVHILDFDMRKYFVCLVKK